MNRARTGGSDGRRTSVSKRYMVLTIAAAALGAGLGIMLRPQLTSGLIASATGPAPKAFWYLSRTSALAAYALLWTSMMLGILLTSKLARLWPGGPTAFELHQYTGLLGLLLAVFHAFILLGDRYIGFSLQQILVPFGAAPFKPVWVGLGQVGLYLTLVVTASFYLRRRIGQRAWRLLHGLSFLMFAMALVHGIMSGTDTTNLWVRAMYWSSGAAVLWATVYRILSTRIAASPRPAVKRVQPSAGVSGAQEVLPALGSR